MIIQKFNISKYFDFNPKFDIISIKTEKEHKKRFKDSKKTKVEVVPQWFNQELDSKELPEDEEEDFKSFIEEIRK